MAVSDEECPPAGYLHAVARSRARRACRCARVPWQQTNYRTS